MSKTQILGIEINSFSSQEHAFDFLISQKANQNYGYVCFANVHMLTEAQKSPELMLALRNALAIFPDGKPLSWIHRARGIDTVQLRGEDTMLEVCSRAELLGQNIGLLGGTPSALSSLKCELHKKFPRLQIPYDYSPPFRALSPKELLEIADTVNSRDIDYLFVGLGCPKQELFMNSLLGKVDCLAFGVGAAFDFISKSKKSAPKWLSKLGMEWCFRLTTEPRRLASRYFITNSMFVFLLMHRRLFYKHLK